MDIDEHDEAYKAHHRIFQRLCKDLNIDVNSIKSEVRSTSVEKLFVAYRQEERERIRNQMIENEGVVNFIYLGRLDLLTVRSHKVRSR